MTAPQKLFVGKSVPTGLWWNHHYPVLLGSGTVPDGSRTAVFPFEVENFRAYMIEKQTVSTVFGPLSPEEQPTHKEVSRQKLLIACHAAIELLEHERDGLSSLSPSATRLHMQLLDAVTATEEAEPV